MCEIKENAVKTLGQFKTSPTAVQEITEQYVAEFLHSWGMAKKLTKAETFAFIKMCTLHKLDPFKREIYVIKYGNQMNIVVGYEVYLKRAQRSKTLNGWKSSFKKEDDDLTCTITIFRKDWNYPFEHTIWLSEYHQNNQMWKTKTKTMLKKVAIAQAFRLCFPEEFDGLPYLENEIHVEPEKIEAEIIEDDDFGEDVDV